jgi:hypothetical protein
MVVVHILVGLPLALCLGNATAAVAMTRMVSGILAATLRNGLVAPVGHVALLLLAAIVVVS